LKSEEELKKFRCGDMSGMEVFAEDEDVYYVFNHPTDVRFVRENYDGEGIEEEQEHWSMINEWANQEVRKEILANNPELDPESYTNTYLDMLLARAAYEPGTKYELRSLAYGPDPLYPATLSDNDFAEELAEDFTYEELPDAQAPDGEYEVLAFDVDGEEVRYDFFHASDSKNLIREVRKVGEEEYETLYQATAKDADDVDETTTDIMEEWCAAIANGGEVDD
jgi:rubrerythrin